MNKKSSSEGGSSIGEKRGHEARRGTIIRQIEDEGVLRGIYAVQSVATTSNQS